MLHPTVSGSATGSASSPGTPALHSGPGGTPLDSYDLPIDNNRVTTSLLPTARPWTTMSRVAYGLNNLVWWTRRLSGERSRQADAQAVAKFVVSRRLWTATTPVAKVSPEALLKLNIEQHFWWIGQEQIVNLSGMLSAYASRQPRGTTENLTELVKDALFPPKTLTF
jgi:hypothetical protein